MLYTVCIIGQFNVIKELSLHLANNKEDEANLYKKNKNTKALLNNINKNKN